MWNDKLKTPEQTNDFAPIPVTKLDPWPHQLAAFNFAKDKDAAGLFVCMGGGKTKIATDLMVNWDARRVLILCPLSVVPVWPKQIDMHAGRPYHVLPLQKGSVAQKEKAASDFLDLLDARDEAGAIVINYESAWRPPFGPTYDDKNRLIDVGFARSVNWDLVILDESHRIKSPGGKASWFAKALAAMAKRRLCLTGTPMPHSPMDLYAQYRFLDPEIFGTSFVRFRNQFAVMGGFNGKQVVDYQNLDRLARKMYSVAIRVSEEDADLNLPEAMHEERTFTLCNKARAAYDQLETDLIAEIKAGQESEQQCMRDGGQPVTVTAANGLVKLLRLQQVTGGWVSTDDGDSYEVDQGKKNMLLDLLTDLKPTEPVVVFCRFVRDLDNVRQIADKAGRGYRELSGRVNELADFQENAGEGYVLGVQIQSGGVGIDLTMARYCVYYSLGFSLGDFEQSLARVHRPGQTKTVRYYHLIAEGTVDEQVYQALHDKAEVVESVLNYLKEV